MTIRPMLSILAFPVLVLSALLVLLVPATRASPRPSDDVLVSDELVAGARGDVLNVRHLVLEGSQTDIGAALTDLARRDLDTILWESRDQRLARLQATYLAQAWPTHHARMAGSARAFGRDLDDPSANFASLAFNMGTVFGCSVMHLPPALTDAPGGLVSRNLDFTSGDIRGYRVGSGELAAMSRPFVIESYPDPGEGHASLFVCSMDLLGGAFDGINEHGLVAALLTDRELMNEHEMEPTNGHGVGISELQLVRYLLETCKDVEEAKDAMLGVKHYFAFVPCHFLVADAQGRSFVFEMSASRNTSYFLENPGEPLVTTNFMLHRYSRDKVPRGDSPQSSFGRWHGLMDAASRARPPVSAEDVPQLHACATKVGPAPPPEVPYAPHRTIWHAVYDPAGRSMSVDFYLGEDTDDYGMPLIRRSGYLEFALRQR